MVVGALLSGDGRPISCEVYRGNQTDVRALLPVVDRARERFALQEVCFVADRGMVSDAVIRGLEERGLGYILGMRLRRAKEVRDVVLSHPGRYRVVEDNLRVKEVKVEDRRYIVCLNPDEEAKGLLETRPIFHEYQGDDRRAHLRELPGSRRAARALRAAQEEGSRAGVGRRGA